MDDADANNLRFGLGLKDTVDIVNEVQDLFEQLDSDRQKERRIFKEEIEKLQKENREMRSNYHDHIYNNREIERCWGAIGHYNRPHLELHEAITEAKRELNEGKEAMFDRILEQGEEIKSLTTETRAWWRWWNEFGSYWYTSGKHPYCEKPPFLKQNDPLYGLNLNKK